MTLVLFAISDGHTMIPDHSPHTSSLAANFTFGSDMFFSSVIGYDLTSVLRAKVFMIRSTTFINWFVLGQV